LRNAHAAFSEVESPYGLGITLRALGMLEGARGNVVQAREYVLNALAEEVKGKEIYEGLKTLVEFSSLRMDEGHSDFVRSILSFAIHHPATPVCYKRRAEILNELRAASSKANGESVPGWQHGRTNFEAVVKHILQVESQA